MNVDTPTPLLNRKQAAEFLGVAPGTLTVWACENRYGIPFVKVGKCVRYRMKDLNDWVNSRLVQPENHDVNNNRRAKNT